MAWSYTTGVLTSTGATEASPDNLLAGIDVVEAADATRGYRNGFVGWINDVRIVYVDSFVKVDDDATIELRGSSFFASGGAVGFIGGARAKLVIRTGGAALGESATNVGFLSGSTFITLRDRPQDPAFSIIYQNTQRHDFPSVVNGEQTLAKVEIDGLDLYAKSISAANFFRLFFPSAIISSVKQIRVFDSSTGTGVANFPAGLNIFLLDGEYERLYRERLDLGTEVGISTTITLSAPFFYRETQGAFGGFIRLGQYELVNPTFLNDCWNGSVAWVDANANAQGAETEIKLMYEYTNRFMEGLKAVDNVNVRFTRKRQSANGSPSWTAPDAVLTATTDAQGTFSPLRLLDAYFRGTSRTQIERFNWTLKARKYDKRTAGETVFADRVFYQGSVDLSNGYSEEVQMLNVAGLTLTQSQAAALTGIVFAASGLTGGTVTITENITSSELWAAYRNWITQLANFDSEDIWAFSGSFNVADWSFVVDGATLTGNITTTGTVTLQNGATIDGAVEDANGVRVTIRRADNLAFNLVARHGTEGDYVDLGFHENTTTQTFTVPKGRPVEFALKTKGWATVRRTLQTSGGGVVFEAEPIFNEAVDTTLDVTGFMESISLSNGGGVFNFVFEADMDVPGIEVAKTLIDVLVSQELALRSTLPPGTGTIIDILGDEIRINQPVVQLILGAGANNVTQRGFINIAPALEVNPNYVINPRRPADNLRVDLPLNKPTLDPTVLALAVRADMERDGGGLQIINNGVKKASLLIPHTEDL